MDESYEIQTKDGPQLLKVGDIITFPDVGYAMKVTAANDLGVRVEFMDWLAGMFMGGERVHSWADVFSWTNYKVWGQGYYMEAAIRHATKKGAGDGREAGSTRSQGATEGSQVTAA
jgi:hypothetical protein